MMQDSRMLKMTPSFVLSRVPPWDVILSILRF